MAVCVKGHGVGSRDRRGNAFLRPLRIQRDIGRDWRGEVKGDAACCVQIPSAKDPTGFRGIGRLGSRLAVLYGLRGGSRAVAVGIKGYCKGSWGRRRYNVLRPTGINGNVACDRGGELVSGRAFLILAPAGKFPTRVCHRISGTADRIPVLHRYGRGRRAVPVAVKGDGVLDRLGRGNAFLRPLGIQRNIRRDRRGEVKGVRAGRLGVPSAKRPADFCGIGGLGSRLAVLYGLRSRRGAVAVGIKGNGVDCYVRAGEGAKHSLVFLAAKTSAVRSLPVHRRGN